MYVAVLVMALLVGALLWAIRTERHALVWVFKPLASLTFLVTALAEGALDHGNGRILFTGLAFAAVGDVLFIVKGKRAFVVGLTSFLFGHVAYAVAFAARGLDFGWVVVAGLVLALAASPVLRWLWPHVHGAMRIPVASYMLVISVMLALAVGTVAASGGGLLLVGAFGFFLSDFAVTRERFVAPGFVNRVVGSPLYFFSQLALAATSGS